MMPTNCKQRQQNDSPSGRATNLVIEPKPRYQIPTATETTNAEGIKNCVFSTDIAVYL